MAGTLTVGGMVAGLISGYKVIGPQTMTGAATIGEIADVTLATGDNTVPIPASTTAALIVLPSSNTQPLKVRTNLDSGSITLAPQGYAVLPIAPGVTGLVLTAISATSIEINFI